MGQESVSNSASFVPLSCCVAAQGHQPKIAGRRGKAIQQSGIRKRDLATRWLTNDPRGSKRLWRRWPDRAEELLPQRLRPYTTQESCPCGRGARRCHSCTTHTVARSTSSTVSQRHHAQRQATLGQHVQLLLSADSPALGSEAGYFTTTHARLCLFSKWWWFTCR
jgi:hypothetical protein